MRTSQLLSALLTGAALLLSVTVSTAQTRAAPAASPSSTSPFAAVVPLATCELDVQGSAAPANLALGDITTLTFTVTPKPGSANCRMVAFFATLPPGLTGLSSTCARGGSACSQLGNNGGPFAISLANVFGSLGTSTVGKVTIQAKVVSAMGPGGALVTAKGQVVNMAGNVDFPAGVKLDRIDVISYKGLYAAPYTISHVIAFDINNVISKLDPTKNIFIKFTPTKQSNYARSHSNHHPDLILVNSAYTNNQLQLEFKTKKPINQYTSLILLHL